VGRFTSVTWSVCPGTAGQASRNALVKYQRNTLPYCPGTSGQFQRYTQFDSDYLEIYFLRESGRHWIWFMNKDGKKIKETAKKRNINIFYPNYLTTLQFSPRISNKSCGFNCITDTAQNILTKRQNVVNFPQNRCISSFCVTIFH
jgi:hypothetical protein